MKLRLRISRMGDRKLIIIPKAYHTQVRVGNKAEVCFNERD